MSIVWSIVHPSPSPSPSPTATLFLPILRPRGFRVGMNPSGCVRGQTQIVRLRQTVQRSAATSVGHHWQLAALRLPSCFEASNPSLAAQLENRLRRTKRTLSISVLSSGSSLATHAWRTYKTVATYGSGAGERRRVSMPDSHIVSSRNRFCAAAVHGSSL